MMVPVAALLIVAVAALLIVAVAALLIVSEPYPIEREVDQGFPVSPLLFAAFIDDLLHSLHS
jgi:hypothetical protein